MSQCGHSKYAFSVWKTIKIDILIGTCTCGAEGLQIHGQFIPFQSTKQNCGHPGPFTRYSNYAGSQEDICHACGETGVHDGFKFHAQIQTTYAGSAAGQIVHQKSLQVSGYGGGGVGSQIALPDGLTVDASLIGGDSVVTYKRAGESLEIKIGEPPKVNPLNPLGCECGAWVVGQNQYGQGHDTFCKLRRN